MNKIRFYIFVINSVILLGPPFGLPVFAAEQWKTNSLTIALIPEKNECDQRRRYRHISSYLADKLSIRVRLKLVPYDQMATILASGEAQAGFFGSLGYVITHKNSGLIPLARPVWQDGTSTYAGLIIVRKDANIKAVADMKNKKLVFVSKSTSAGYVFPNAYLLQSGVSDVERYFSSVVYSGSHEGAAWAVYSREADVGAVKNHIFNELKNDNPSFAEEMMVLTKSRDVPSNSFAISPHVDPKLRAKIQKLLLNMHLDPKGREQLAKFGAQKFIVTTDNHFQPCFEMLKNAGIDLATQKVH